MEGAVMIWMAVAGVVAVAVWRFVLRPDWRSNLPPGTVGWPFLGECIPFFFRPYQFITKRREKYGNLFRTSLLGYQTVISTDPRASNYILQNEGRLFVPQYPTSVTHILGKSNMLEARGDSHKIKRGGVMRLIGISVLKQRLLSEIQTSIASSILGWKGRTVNVTHEAQEMIFSLMANYLFSIKAGTELDKMRHNFYVLKRGFFKLPINIPGTSFYKSLQKRKELNDQIKTIIEERNKNVSSHDSYDDLLSLILKEATEREDGEIEFATFQIIDLIIGLLFAAIETTPQAIALVVNRLSENPQIIQELREEHEAIRRTKGKNESLSWDDYKSMTFTKNVIKEALRLGSGRISNIMVRKTIQDVEMEGYTIPKGWTCIMLDKFSNLDSEYYTDPLAFNPRRWQSSDVNQTPYLAFGGGPRLCLGFEFATMVISFFLHHLVTNFDWEYIPSDTKSKWFHSPFMPFIDGMLMAHFESRA